VIIWIGCVCSRRYCGITHLSSSSLFSLAACITFMLRSTVPTSLPPPVGPSSKSMVGIALSPSSAPLTVRTGRWIGRLRLCARFLFASLCFASYWTGFKWPPGRRDGRVELLTLLHHPPLGSWLELHFLTSLRKCVIRHHHHRTRTWLEKT